MQESCKTAATQANCVRWPTQPTPQRRRRGQYRANVNFAGVGHLGSICCTHLPDAGQGAEVDVPALLRALVLDDVHALGVGADLGRVQRVGHVLDQLLLVHALHPEKNQVTSEQGYAACAWAMTGGHLCFSRVLSMCKTTANVSIKQATLADSKSAPMRFVRSVSKVRQLSERGTGCTLRSGSERADIEMGIAMRIR